MKYTHLSIDDRRKIQEGIEQHLTKSEIAKDIGKDPTTVSKEIKKRRKLKPRNHLTLLLLVLNLKNVVYVKENVPIMKKSNV